MHSLKKAPQHKAALALDYLPVFVSPSVDILVRHSLSHLESIILTIPRSFSLIKLSGSRICF